MLRKNKSKIKVSDDHPVIIAAQYIVTHMRDDEKKYWQREARKHNFSLQYTIEKSLVDFYKLDDSDYKLEERNK